MTVEWKPVSIECLYFSATWSTRDPLSPHWDHTAQSQSDSLRFCFFSLREDPNEELLTRRLMHYS